MHQVIARPIPGASVELAPMLDGGSAGWCVATSRLGSGAGCGGSKTSTGPIFFESCKQSYSGNFANDKVDVIVLVKGEVAAVSVAGGRAVPTEFNSTLPSGFRAAAIELPGYKILAKRPGIIAKPIAARDPWSPCPRVIPLNASRKPIDRPGKAGAPLVLRLPRLHWEPPMMYQPNGPCGLSATSLPRETTVIEGTIAIRVKPLQGLIGHAFISCAETTYLYGGEHHLPAAILLDAMHPGAAPFGLPGMKPLSGHPSVFEAPPNLFARRVRNAWLVVEEEDNIGPTMPVELLEHLRAVIHL